MNVIKHYDGFQHADSGEMKMACKDCQRIRALRKGLIEFGYTSLTWEDAQQSYEIAMTRKPTAEDGIIAMMIRSQLLEAGLVSES